MITLNNQQIEFFHFNDGNCKFTCTPPTMQRSTVVWKYDGDEEIIQLYYLLSHLKAHHCYVRLIAPYFPSARQDRCPHEQDVFTLKYTCNLFNMLNIDEIQLFDVHSPVTTALLNNIKMETPEDLLRELLFNTLSHNILIAYPDTGSEHRYSAMLRLPYITGCKERDWETGKVRKMYLVGANHLIAGHSFLIVDDIIGQGSTIYGMSKLLKEQGADKIYVYASHTENTVLTPCLNGQSLVDIPDLIEKIYTTDSIYRGHHPKIEVIRHF